LSPLLAFFVRTERELNIPQRTLTFILAHVVFRVPILIEFLMLMSIFFAESSLLIIAFLILITTDSGQVVSILIDSVKPFNALLIALSILFVIFSLKLVCLSLNSLVYLSNFVSMSVTCVCYWIGIHYAVVSLVCKLCLLAVCAMDLLVEFEQCVLVSRRLFSVGVISDRQAR